MASSTIPDNNTTRRRPSKVPCEICGLMFETEEMKEEHKKLEHVQHKRPSGVG